ncbi:hypothetical protein NKH77_44650 [Streptomyces sp. M19]
MVRAHLVGEHVRAGSPSTTCCARTRPSGPAPWRPRRSGARRCTASWTTTCTPRTPPRCCSTGQAADHAHRPLPGANPVRPPGHREAMAWFTAERAVLVAAVQRAADSGFTVHAWQLAWSLVDFFDRQGHWGDLIATHRIALAATGDPADRVGRAHTHCGFVRGCARLGRYDEATGHLQRALALFTELGDLVGRPARTTG